MKLKYYLIPMQKAAAWQVVDGDINGLMVGKYCMFNADNGFFFHFESNAERDEWIAAVHKHLAEWAYGKEDVPEAVREADFLFSQMIKSMKEAWLWMDASRAWREKWMKPREPKEIEKYLYEV